MIKSKVYIDNLELIRQFKNVKGDIVECGVWRGGMIAGVAKIMKNNKKYHLFDSFEGLPEVKKIDGEAAIKWQKNILAENYYDNCKAEERWAVDIMDTTKVNYFIYKGWFCDTLPKFKNEIGISVLRMDGDWYESTMSILDHLFEKVNKGGVVIIDDYYAWDGCAKAVHEYLSANNLSNRIQQYNNNIAYIVK